MIHKMSPEQKSTVEAELEMLEKLYALGDDAGARMIARRLLISHTLSSDEKRRIKKVIDATKRQSVLGLIVLAAVMFALVYLYLQYFA